ncbi:MAG: hypothetical protein GY816_05710 [Cytophagales bacterium]|nr:hypothetical protein [Cytophagales bacterium]
MKALQSLYMSLMCSLLFIGCMEVPLESRVTTSNLLAGDDIAGRSYFISSAEVSLFNLNGTLQLEECVTDNTIIYYPSSRYEENEGRTKCEIDNPPGSLGTWAVTNNETEISIVIDSDEELWKIESVTSQGHTLTRSTTDGEITFVLKRFD